MAKRISAKNIVGLAFIAPVLVLIAFIAIIAYIFGYEETTLGDAMLYLLIPVFAVPALVLAIFSISLTATRAKIKWLWTIPLGVITAAVVLSSTLVTTQINTYRSRCESYASWEATLSYLSEDESSILQIDQRYITNPGQDAYDILIVAPVEKNLKATTMLLPYITWKSDDCTLTICYQDITCERTMTIRGASNTYRMRYHLEGYITRSLADKVRAKFIDLENS